MCPHKKERGSKDSLKTGHFFNFSQDCNPTKRITRSKTGAVAKHPAQEANHYTTHVTRTLENRRETPKNILVQGNSSPHGREDKTLDHTPPLQGGSSKDMD